MQKEPIKKQGTINYQDIETGFWTFKSEDEKIYRIVDEIEEIQIDDLKVELEFTVSEKIISVFMMGIPIEIISFKIIN